MHPVETSVTNEPRLASRGEFPAIERLGWLLTFGVAIYSVAIGVWEASRRALWFDEVFTAVVAKKQGFSDVFAALAAQVDTSGPTYYLIVRAISELVSDPHIALRLPSIIAVSLTGLVVFATVRRDVGVTGATVCAFVVFNTQLYHGYSIEARPYALLALGAAGAVFAWRRADEGRWAVALAVLLVASISLHYYAVFVIGPLAVAEAVTTWQTGQWRVRIWGAFAAGAGTLAMMWPLLSGLRAYYGDAYWSRPSVGKVLATYDTLLGFDSMGIGVGISLALSAAMAGMLWRNRSRPAADRGVESSFLALTVGLMGLPPFVAAVSAAMNGGYAGRYALPVVIGVSLASAVVAGAIPARRQMLVLLGLAFVFGAREVSWAARARNRGLNATPAMNVHGSMMERAGGYGLPLWVLNPQDFLPLVYYNPEASVSIVATVDRARARRCIGTDSLERDLEVLSSHMPLNVLPYAEFRARYSRFLVLSRPGPYGWWMHQLRASNVRLTLVDQLDTFALYLAEVDGSPTDVNASCGS